MLMVVLVVMWGGDSFFGVEPSESYSKKLIGWLFGWLVD
jgi:hypothetical protein